MPFFYNRADFCKEAAKNECYDGHETELGLSNSCASILLIFMSRLALAPFRVIFLLMQRVFCFFRKGAGFFKLDTVVRGLNRRQY